ncbi:MAG: HAD family phosphatase [Thermodesulfobacteriota bacterium]
MKIASRPDQVIGSSSSNRMNLLAGRIELKAVIFDLDGVILDSMPSHVAAWREVFGDAGLNLETGFFYRNEGMLDWPRLEAALGDNLDPDFGPEDFQRLLESQRRVYLDKYAGKVSVFESAEELLNRNADQGRSLALVTSSPRQVLSADIFSWLEGHFDLIVTGDMVRRTKPYPDPYLQALSGLGVEPESALAVENAPAGIESAQAAGICCLALTTTLSPSDLAAADMILRDHESLLTFLDGFPAPRRTGAD